MRKFALLLLAYTITLFGLRAIANDAGFTAYVLRDGLLIALVGVILFAANAAPLYRPIVTNIRVGWRNPGRILWVTGVIAALIGGLLMFIDSGNPAFAALRVTLWLLGLLLMLAGAGWPGEARHFSPPTHRWDVDEQGEFIRRPTDDMANTEAIADQSDSLGRTVKWVTLLIIVLIGAGLRLWKLGQLPGGCVDAECALGLQLMQGGRLLIDAGRLSPYGWLAQFFFGMTDQGLLSLRMAGATFGIATLPMVYLVARQISTSTGALLATALLALSPWHIIVSRGAEPWIVLPLLFSLGIWAILRSISALDHGGTGRLHWALAGVSLGMTALVAPQLLYALWLWVGLIGVIILVIRRADWRDALPPLLILMATTLLTSLPMLADAEWLVQFNFVAGGIPGLITELLNTRAWRLGLPMLATVTAAFTLSGAGVLARWWRGPSSLILLLGVAMLGGQALMLRTEPAGIFTPALLLPLLPLIFVLAAVALDQLIGHLTRLWARVIPPAIMVGVLLGLLLLVVGRNTLTLMRDLDRLTIADNPAMTAMATYLVDTFDMDAATPIPEQTMLFAPPALFETPSARLLAGPLLESAQIQPLTDLNELVAATAHDIDIKVLALAEDQALHALMAELYPRRMLVPEYDVDGQPLFTLISVNAADASFRPGLSGLYRNDAESINLVSDQRDGPLHFDWATRDDLTAPFSVSWTGSLLVPESGRYHFAVAGGDDPQTTFSLQLDDQIILDSSLGLFERAEILADGHAGLTMRYATTATAPPPLVINWTRPDGVTEAIPLNALVSPALPNIGLLATYYADDGFAGPALDLRKELLIGAPIAQAVDAPAAGSVVWRGKLAASRAGEYALGALADGRFELMLDGRTLVHNGIVNDGEGALENYREARTYLDRGWHEFDLRFVPATDGSALRLFWQPPGGSSAPLPSAYLAPIRPEITELDYPLPAPPPLNDDQLGDDRFALTRGDSAQPAQPVAPPEGLPPLPSILMWQTTAGCGDGPTQLARPHGVAMDLEAGRIYVADTANRRIAVYNLTGDALATIADERFLELTDVALVPGGALLTLDAAEGQLFHIDPRAQTVEHFPVGASFYHPRGLGTDKLGMIAVADTGGARVVVIDPGGSVVGEFGGQGTAFGRNQPVDALLGNALWAITAEDGRLWSLYFDAGFTAIGKAVSMDGPHLAGLENGAFFLTDPARRTLFYHRENGQPMNQFAYPDFFATPTGIAAATIDDVIQLAVVDTARCSLSLWQVPADGLE